MPLDRARFRVLFESHRDAVYRFLCRLCRHTADAEDLLQETYLTVWRKREQYRGDGSDLAYLRRCAFRLFLNQRAKQKRRAELAPDRRPPEPSMPHRILEEQDARRLLLGRVRSAVEALPDGPREAFVMFRFEGMPCREIAEMTGVPVKTIETRIRRATQLLAEALGPVHARERAR